jgi:transposase
MFEELLCLGEGWRIQEVKYLEKEKKVALEVRNTALLWKTEECPRCHGKEISGYDHAPERRWRHLNVCQLQSEVVCSLPRGKCRDCGHVYTVKAPWEGRSPGLTQEFEAFALLLMREMPVKKAGEILGETDQKLWRALFAHVQAAWAELSWEGVVWVGADEMNRRKGHNYLTVFVDLEARRVLLAVEGKDASVWERFAEQLLKHNGHPKAITRVAIDMSPAYKRGVRENLGNAVVTFDKFHVVSLVAAALEKVRRKEVSQSAQAREELVKTAWLFRKNPEDWTEAEEQRWEQLKDKPLVTGLAYAMRLEFQEIYKAGSAKEAKSKLEKWCQWVKMEASRLGTDLLEPMRQAARTVQDHIQGILGHWEGGLTTAYLEGLNSLFSATKRKARGYRTTEYQTAMLYFIAGKLQIPYYG